MGTTNESERQGEKPPGIRDTVLDDLRRGDVKRTVRRDLRDLYQFYLDPEKRSRLQRMGRVRRWLHVAGGLAKGLILRLTPARRILLLIAIILFFQGPVFTFDSAERTFNFEFRPLGFLLVLLILMLELKDKLLARDELEVGRAVQLALLPDGNPRISGWDLWLFTRPANDVGGDLVDYLRVSDRRLGLTLGDVAGKGLGAALLMAKLQATVRALATETRSIEDLGARLNAIFCRDQVPSRFATLMYLELEPDSGLVKILNAGHLPPITVGGDSISRLDPVAPALGLVPDAGYREQQVTLAPGDMLVAFSDGVTEAMDNESAFFGEERLLRILPGLRALPVDAAGRRVLKEVEDFVGEERLSDDLSLILLRRRPAGVKRGAGGGEDRAPAV